MRILATALLLTSAACSTPRSYDYSREPDPRRSEYVVGISDHLSIQVWKNLDLSREVAVRPDGTITLPLIGDVPAAGRTPTQLRDDITGRLSKYLRSESIVVTVAVTTVNSYVFTVSGNVERPGVFSSARYLTVFEAIQLAGGPNRFASPGNTTLYRRDGKAQRAIPIDYPALQTGKSPEANLVILPGDQINVP